MLTYSHQEQRIEPARLEAPDLHLLADAFSDFISASASLEASYGKLKEEVAQLSEELAERNCALKLSLAENDRIHLALRQIVDALPCGVLVLEPTGAVSMINPEGRELLSLGDQDLASLHHICELTGIGLDLFLRPQSEDDSEQEFCLQTTGKKQWLSIRKRNLSAQPIAAADQNPRQQIILILRDITPHKNAEAERERARRAIALSEVSTTLAHEIRNPLTSLELFAGLIAKGGPEMPLYVSHLHAGIRSLAGTVNNVLAVHGNNFPTTRRMNLVAALQSSVEFARPIADEAGVVLHFETAADEIEIEGNASALQQLCLNLLSNAIRHTCFGGEICVKVQVSARDQRRAQISFSDTGSGIAPQHLEHIFSLGFSADGGSSGLGLAVCKQVIEQHRGTINVVSQLTLGTTFTVEIPIA